MKSKSQSQSHVYAALGMLLALIIFYPGLFLVKMAPLTGDHLEQHYPWAKLLAESVKHFRLPIWTPFIHSGFPIAAESQIAIFYVPHLILYLLLPFRVAYSWMDLIHFFISGWATWLYCRKMKMDPLPSFVAAMIFLFGAGYGGAYYNITSLKTICWFPVSLWAFEKFYREKHYRSLGWIVFGMSMALVAGYLQVATLMWLIFLAYAALRFFFISEGSAFKQSGQAVMALAITFVLAASLTLPQIILTYPLALESNRSGLSESYAYIGSLSPFILVTLIDPLAQNILRGNCLYSGLFGLFLMFAAFSSAEIRKLSVFRLWAVMGAIAALLAFGRWSPLYVALIKLTHFYSFRMPSKFLIFICFAFSIFSGLGTQALLKAGAARSKAVKAYYAVISVFVLFAAAVYAFMEHGRPLALKAGEWYVRHFVYGKAGHPHSLEEYLHQLFSVIDSVKSLYSLQNSANIGTLFILLFSLVLVFCFRGKKVSKKWIYVGLIFLFVDLYHFSWMDIQQDFASYTRVDNPAPVVRTLEALQKEGRVGRLYGYRGLHEGLPLIPSANMVYGIEDIGAYSPFVTQRYFETIGQFGNINDSTFAASPSPEFVIQHLPLLDALNVSHVLSNQEFSHPQLKFLLRDPGGAYLYENEGKRGKAYFVARWQIYPDWNGLKEDLMKPAFNPQALLLIERDEAEKISGLPDPAVSGNHEGTSMHLVMEEPEYQEWEVDTAGPGFFVIPNTWFQGWRVEVNGQEKPLIRAYGLFQAVYLEGQDKYRVEFSYRPFSGKRFK